MNTIHMININRKSSFRYFQILLFCFSLILCSCSSSTENVTDHSAYLNDITEQAETAIEECNLIVPSDASPELIESARKLSREFAERFGITSSVYFDNEPVLSSKNTIYIFLGNTSYDLSRSKTARLKIDDYVCTSVGDDIILGGKSSSATVAAIERFISEVLPVFDLQNGLSEEDRFEYRGEYLYTNITVNGYSLDDYTIAYPSSALMREKEIAYALRERIAELCGAYPDILRDRETKASDRLICIGACFDDEITEAQIACHGSNIKLCGSSENLIAQSAQSFYEMLCSSQELDINGHIPTEAISSEITFMTVFPNKIDGEEDLSNVVNVCKEIDQKKPTLICFDFPSSFELSQFESNLDEYTRIGNSLFILSDKCTVIALSEISNIVCADISIGEDYRFRAIIADTSGEDGNSVLLETAISKISDTDTTVIFTITDAEYLGIKQEGSVILNTEQSKDGRRILLTVFAPNGSASLSSDSSIIINHPFLR